MQKTRLLILGYSSFLKRRVIPAIKKIKQIKYSICSKSSKINLKEKVLFNDYDKALAKTNSTIVYITLINSLHFKYAKKALEKGFNVIVDKPITTSLNETKQLLTIAKKKKLLLAEATVYNYHKVFEKMIKLCGGINNILHVQANFNLLYKKKVKEIAKIKADCAQDMGPYAASIIRLFLNNNIEDIIVFKNYFKDKRVVKDFYITAKSNNCTFFGNFSSNSAAYMNQIIFFTKKKIISSPNKIFSLPTNKNLSIFVLESDKINKIKVGRDDCIKNFFNTVLHAFNRKNFNYFYNNILIDAKIRKEIG